jgi:hypothetical protein
MEETIITFPTAKLAAEKGYSKPVVKLWGNHYYNYKGELDGNVLDQIKEFVSSKRENREPDSKYDNTLAVTQGQLQTWLRETHGIKLWCAPHEYSSSDGWAYNILARKEGIVTVSKGNQASSVHLTYEQALEEGLIEALKQIQ